MEVFVKTTLLLLIMSGYVHLLITVSSLWLHYIIIL